MVNLGRGKSAQPSKAVAYTELEAAIFRWRTIELQNKEEWERVAK